MHIQPFPYLFMGVLFLRYFVYILKNGEKSQPSIHI